MGLNCCVDLVQVERVDLQALQRAAQLGGCAGRVARHGLAAQEELAAHARHPWPDALLGQAIRGRHIDVVHASRDDLLHDSIGPGLRGRPERGRAEDGYGAGVVGASETAGLHGGGLQLVG